MQFYQYFHNLVNLLINFMLIIYLLNIEFFDFLIPFLKLTGFKIVIYGWENCFFNTSYFYQCFYTYFNFLIH